MESKKALQGNINKTSSSEQGNGGLANNINKQRKFINVRLDQANEYELVE